MWTTLQRFGMRYCDVKTMLWNVAVMLRALTLNIDGRNKTPIPIIFYVLSLSIALGYFYVYLVSMIWFVFSRCPATGDLLAAIVVFSLGASSEIGTVKLVYMFWHIDKVKEIVSECLACDSFVVPGSRFSVNLLTTLRHVKKRAMVFWVVIIGNGVVYLIKPVIMPGRHLPEDMFVLYVEFFVRKWRNVRDYYIREKKKVSTNPAPATGPQRKKKKYHYYDSLTFLDNNKPKSCTVSNSGEEMENSQNSSEYLGETSNDLTYEFDQYKLKHEIVDLSPDYVQDEGSSEMFESHVLNSLDTPKDDDTNVKANQNFLMSLLPDMTSLNERQNMRFRIGLEPMYENPNFQIASLLMVAGVIFTCYLPANITAFLIVVTGYIEAQMLSLTEELLHLWEDAEEHYYRTKNISILGENNEQIAVKNKVINDYVEKHLKDIIVTHGKNINLLHQVEYVFSGAIALEFFLLVVGLIAELLGGLENTYLEIPFALMQVGMDCFAGQRVMDAGIKFERAVYDCKWENYNLSNMKIVLMMLQNSQKMMKLSAGGIIMLNFSCLMQVIRSIYSAYTTLRSTMK